jgi:hypothetical protein
MLALLEHVLETERPTQHACSLSRVSQLWQPGSGLAVLLPEVIGVNNKTAYLLLGQDAQGTCAFSYILPVEWCLV